MDSMCTNGHVQLHGAPCSCGAPKAEPDPWVKVGTTTIDGNMKQVYEVLGVSPWPWLCASDTTGAINHFMRAEQPWLIGGRHLRGVGSHWDAQADTAVIHCDVVRRRSEIDAEHQRGKADGECKSCGALDCLSTHGTCSRCCDRAENPCPECGPHGNAGRVLLLESWVDCTTCRPTAAALSVEFDGISSLRHDPTIAETYPTMGDLMEAQNWYSMAACSAHPSIADEYRRYMEREHAGFAARLQVPQDLLFGTGPAGFESEQRASSFGMPTVATMANYLEAVRQCIIEATPLDGQVILDNGKTVATYIDGREVSRRGRF